MNKNKLNILLNTSKRILQSLRIIKTELPNSERPDKSQMTYYEKKKLCRDWIALIVTILGFIVAFSSLGFSIYYTSIRFDEAKDLNKRQTAINEIYKLKNRDYINTISRLHMVAASLDYTNNSFNDDFNMILYETENPDKAIYFLMNDISFSFNTFENLAAFYSHDLVDREIIDSLICDEVKEFNFLFSKITPVLSENSHEYISKLPTKDFKYLLKICGGDIQKFNSVIKR